MEDFRREVDGVGVEVGEETLEVGDRGSGSEGRATPVMQECAISFGVSWSEVFEDDLAVAQVSESLRIRIEGEEVSRGAMLLRQSRFDGLRIGIEGGCGGRGGLSEEARRVQAE